jgi:hypothetical protein
LRDFVSEIGVGGDGATQLQPISGLAGSNLHVLFVRIDRVEKVARNVWRFAAESFSTSVRICRSVSQPDKSSYNEEKFGFSRRWRCVPSVLQRDARFCSSGRESVLSRSQTPAINDDEVRFRFASGVTDWKSVSEMTRTPRPFICSKKLRFAERMNITSQRFDVSAGGDHVHGNGNARVRAIAESLNQLFRRSAGGAVGDLLAEVVSFIELFAHDFYDVVGV